MLWVREMLQFIFPTMEGLLGLLVKLRQLQEQNNTMFMVVQKTTGEEIGVLLNLMMVTFGFMPQ